jgi:predicted RecA/RadA family phage recombinase
MALNLNQFQQGAIAGTLDLGSSDNDSIFRFRIDPDSTATDLQVGKGVRLVDGGANDPNDVPLVDGVTVDTQAPVGVILYSTENNDDYSAGDVVTVATQGAVIRMQASGALNRGVRVALDADTPLFVQAVASNAAFGILLDKATAANDIVRVKITAEGV